MASIIEQKTCDVAVASGVLTYGVTGNAREIVNGSPALARNAIDDVSGGYADVWYVTDFGTAMPNIDANQDVAYGSAVQPFNPSISGATCGLPLFPIHSILRLITMHHSAADDAIIRPVINAALIDLKDENPQVAAGALTVLANLCVKYWWELASTSTAAVSGVTDVSGTGTKVVRYDDYLQCVNFGLSTIRAMNGRYVYEIKDTPVGRITVASIVVDMRDTVKAWKVLGALDAVSALGQSYDGVGSMYVQSADGSYQDVNYSCLPVAGGSWRPAGYAYDIAPHGGGIYGDDLPTRPYLREGVAIAYVTANVTVEIGGIVKDGTAWELIGAVADAAGVNVNESVGMSAPEYITSTGVWRYGTALDDCDSHVVYYAINAEKDGQVTALETELAGKVTELADMQARVQTLTSDVATAQATATANVGKAMRSGVIAAVSGFAIGALVGRSTGE